MKGLQNPYTYEFQQLSEIYFLATDTKLSNFRATVLSVGGFMDLTQSLKQGRLKKIPAFQLAKRNATGFQDAVRRSMVGDAPMPLDYYSIPWDPETDNASLEILKAAFFMVDPEINLVLDVKTETLDIQLPFQHPTPPVQQVIHYISTLRHALVDHVHHTDDGRYIIEGKHLPRTFDVAEFINQLTCDFIMAEKLPYAVKDNRIHADWTMAKIDQPRVDSFYLVPDDDGTQRLMDAVQLDQLNRWRKQHRLEPHDPEECFDHAVLNGAAMQLLSAATGIVSSRATTH